MSFFQRWKDKWTILRLQVKAFPVRWLSYGARLKNDLERLYNEKDGSDFFTKEYRESLEKGIRQLEGWQLKIMTAQYAILIFFALAIFSNEATVSILGISVKNSSGVKEILLIVSTTLALLSFLVTSMKDLRVAIVEKLVELQTGEKFSDFAQVAYGNSFYMRAYFAKQFQRGLFPTLFNIVTFRTVTVLLAVAGIMWFGFVLALQIYIFVDVFSNSTVAPLLKHLVLIYGAIALIFGFLWLLRMWVPLPYTDQQNAENVLNLNAKERDVYFAAMDRVYGVKREPGVG